MDFFKKPAVSIFMVILIGVALFFGGFFVRSATQSKEKKMKLLPKFLVNGIQDMGGKAIGDLINNLQVKGSGAIQVSIGEIAIDGVNLNFQVVKTDEKNNKQLVNVTIPVSARIKPTPMMIPITLSADLKKQ